MRRTVVIPHLPTRLRGLSIAVISDIHSGTFMEKPELDIYVQAVNSLDPDVILLPGDFVQHRDEEIEAAAEALQHLRAPYGVYGCTGNHDHYADVNLICRELGNAGVRMLRDEHIILDVKGESLALIGMDDDEGDRSVHSHFLESVEGLDRSLPHILLCHKPYYLDEASEKGVNLMVSGHTHGGQIVLARILNCVITPAALWSPYIEGLYRLDATQLYVTRGIGTVGLPLRWNCPAEITLLTLA